MSLISEIAAGQCVHANDIVKLFPNKNGEPISKSTLARWHRIGIKTKDGRRVKLELIRLGNMVYSSQAAIERFVRATADEPGTPVRSGTKRAKAAVAQLKKMGVRVGK